MKYYDFNIPCQQKRFTVQQKCHKVTSRPLLASNQLEISLSAAVVFASDRYVFVSLCSVWCKECPRRALKSTIQGPKCQSTSPQPFRATKPSDSTKMASVAFFVLQSGSYKWPHSTPVWHLTGLWILSERPDVKKYTLRWGAFGGQSVSAFTLLMNSLNGVPLDGKFWTSKRIENKVQLELVVGMWEVAKNVKVFKDQMAVIFWVMVKLYV